jgi:hypothetical protein
MEEEVRTKGRTVTGIQERNTFNGKILHTLGII